MTNYLIWSDDVAHIRGICVCYFDLKTISFLVGISLALFTGKELVWRDNKECLSDAVKSLPPDGVNETGTDFASTTGRVIANGAVSVVLLEGGIVVALDFNMLNRGRLV